MKNFLVGLLTSRRVVAAIAGAVASFLVPYLNRKYGLGLDAAEVTTTVGSALGLAFTYIVARTVTDVKGTVPAPTTPTTPQLPPEVQAVIDALPKK